MLGVSVVICCHNSRQRLERTLEHLIRQKCSEDIPWDVIVVDNASTDGTAQFVIDFWKGFSSVHLKLIPEPKLGLSNARKRGFQEAQYEFISFVDDDNWLAPDWVETAFKIMLDHPDVGACGGDSEAVFDDSPPSWFKKFQSSYAVGKQAEIASDLSYLWGAGLTIRKTALKSLVAQGYHPFLSGRRGKELTAGEDSELCLALRCAGWRLWYEPKLCLKHFISGYRTKWDILRKMHRGFGASQVALSLYLYAIKDRNPEELKGRWITKIWLRKTIDLVKDIYQQRQNFWRLLINPLEGDEEVLNFERFFGFFFELLRWCDDYDNALWEIWKAPWRKQ